MIPAGLCKKGIEVLDNDTGFFMMVEGGKLVLTDYELVLLRNRLRRHHVRLRGGADPGGICPLRKL